MDASEEHEGYSSGEDPLKSDPEDDSAKKLVSLAQFHVSSQLCQLCPAPWIDAYIFCLAVFIFLPFKIKLDTFTSITFDYFLCLTT